MWNSPALKANGQRGSNQAPMGNPESIEIVGLENLKGQTLPIGMENPTLEGPKAQ